jgi:acyl-[acyl-carrier-protein]-phospholipid O-acyltransferase / long-chain-fatty-acid--[acyl-carrier-protein] ligase
MFGELMKSRRFAPMFWCQLLSALSDNFVKNALIIVVLFQAGDDGSGALVTLASGALIAPFLLLSALGGELADKYDKARMAQTLKLAEIPIALIAATGFALSSVPLLFIALLLFGVIAALFGPVKYGILPDHLEKRQLPAANALFEGATFLAILTGTIIGGLAAAGEGSSLTLAIAVLAFASVCWASAKFIPPTGAAAPELAITANPVTSTVALLRDLRSQQRLWVGGLTTSWFWLVGIVALSLLPTIIKQRVGGTPGVVTLGLFVFTVGIALGSLLAARASRSGLNLKLIPIGALLMGLVCLDLAWVVAHLDPGPNPVSPSQFLGSLEGVRLVVDLLALSAAGGLFIVPAFTAVQSWAPPDRRARVVAAVNVLNAALMTAGSLGLSALQVAGVSLPLLLLALGAGNLIVMLLVRRAWDRVEMTRPAASFDAHKVRID